MIKVWINDNEDFVYVCSFQEVVQPDGTTHVVLDTQNVTDLRVRLEPFDKSGNPSDDAIKILRLDEGDIVGSN